jgi:hypothetical protein
LDEDKHPKRMRSDDGSLRLSLPHPEETHEAVESRTEAYAPVITGVDKKKPR